MSDTNQLTGRMRRLPRLTGLALVSLIIIANGIVALLVLNGMRQASARVDRAHQVMATLKAIEDVAESGGRDQRGYRVSGDPALLAAFRGEQAALTARLTVAKELIADDQGASMRFAGLVRLIDRDQAELEATLTPVESRFDTGHLPDALSDSVGRSNAIVTAIDDMMRDERVRLSEQLALINGRNTVLLCTVVFGAIASMALITMIITLMRRDANRNEQLADAHSGALRDSELRFRRIFEESPLGIILAEPRDHRIVQANPAFCRMLGYHAEQIVGRTLTDLAHIDDRDLLTEATGHGVEMRYVTSSAILTWARVSLAQLSTAEQRPALLLALVEDITREKRAEAELRQAQKMEAVGQLTGGIAHDFNNLLGVIIGNAEFLMDAAESRPEQTHLAQEILDSAMSGADLTRRLLAFARRQTLQPRRIDLNAYLPNHVAIIRRLLGETIQVTTTLADDLWPTRADPSQVGDALLNLAINARDAMPHGGHIQISTANAHLDADQPDDLEVAPGDYVVLSVTDTGIGMPREVLERAVEPFFTTKEPGSGSGLGLSMIFGFAKQSGGHLTITSVPGRGTKVRLYLPRVQGLEVEATESAGEAPLPGGDETILLVDDNTEMRAVARRHLLSLGYSVSEAGNGPAALAILQDGGRFDLLFTDVVMPEGMTGYQLAAAARHVQPGLKVLLTTGYAGPGRGYEPLGAQRATILPKPYRKQELATTVRAVLEA